MVRPRILSPTPENPRVDQRPGLRFSPARGAVLTLALLSAALLVGCGEETPTDYGEQVRSNFLEQCLGDSDSSGDGGTEALEELRAECECMYDSLSDNLSFAEFEELDSEVRADQDSLPDRVNDLLVRCIVES